MFDIDVTLDVQVLDQQMLPGFNSLQSGVIVAGSFAKPITLWFMTFSDTTFATSPALKLEVLTSQKAFGLDIGLSFFDEHFATGNIMVAEVAGTQDQPELQVNLNYAGDIALLKNAQIAFTYSKQNGFHLTKLPFSTQILLDFQKVLQAVQALGQTPCSDLVNLAFQELITTNFYLKPSMTGSSQGGDLQVDLNGIYSLTITGTTSPFLYVNMPTLHLTIKETDNLKLSTFPQFLIDNIISNTASVIGQMINDPVKWAAFISVLSAKALAQHIITEALCETAEAAEDAAEATEAAEAAEAASTAAEAAEAAEAGMAAAAAAGGGVEAAGAATAAGLAAVGAGATVGIVGFIKSVFGGSDDDTGGGGKPPEKLQAVSGITLSYSNGISIGWNASGQTALRNQWFKVELYNASDKNIGTQFIYGATSASFTQLPASKKFYIKITAYALGYTTSDTATSGTLNQLAAPTLAPITIAGTTVTVSLAQNLASGQSAQAQLVLDGQPTGAIKPMSGQPATVQFNLTNTSVTSVQARAQILANDSIPSDWQVTPNAITRLAAPTLQPLSLAGNMITATLQAAVPNADTYQAKLVV
jgi:hypothetical protein